MTDNGSTDKTVNRGKAVLMELAALLLLALFAVILNRKVHISWMYIDDLSMWDWYRSESFWEFSFPAAAKRLRTVSWAAIWLLFRAAGTHMKVIVGTLIALLVFTAAYLRRFLEELSGSFFVSVSLALVFIASRFSYYNVSQVLGLTEALPLLFFLCMSRRLWRYMHHGTYRDFRLSLLFYVLAVLSHERYMVLLPMLFFAVVTRKEEKKKVLLSAVILAVFVLVQLARRAVTGSFLPVGTGGTDVAGDFSKKGFVLNVFMGLAYMAGINAGPLWLCGTPWESTPLFVRGAVVIFLAVIVRIFMIFAACVKEKKKFPVVELLYFSGFIIGLVTASSVTVRVEMRWVYAPFAAALLLMAYVHGFCRSAKRTNVSLLLISACILMLFCDLWYRGHSDSLYLNLEQKRRESFIEKTYGAFGDRVTAYDIYVLGNVFALKEYEEKLFNKPIGLFEGELSVKHVSSEEEIPADGKEKIVLYEVLDQNVYDYAAVSAEKTAVR